MQASSKAQRSPPTPLTLPLNQQCSAATPFPTPASVATTRASPSAAPEATRAKAVTVCSQDLLARCQEFASGLSASGCLEVVEVALHVATSGQVAVKFAVNAGNQASAHSHRLFRSLSIGLGSRDAQHAVQLQSPSMRLQASPLASPLAILPASGGGSMHDDHASAFDDAHTSFLSHSTAPAWHPQDGDAVSATCMRKTRTGNSPLGLAIHLDTASAAKLAQTELAAESTAESVGETWSMATPTQLSGRDTAGTGISQGVASNVSELYERGFQLEQSLQDIDARGCFRAGQVRHHQCRRHLPGLFVCCAASRTPCLGSLCNAAVAVL